MQKVTPKLRHCCRLGVHGVEFVCLAPGDPEGVIAFASMASWPCPCPVTHYTQVPKLACVAIRIPGGPYSEAPHDFLGLMSTGSLRDMEAGEEAKAMDVSPMEQEATAPEAPATEEPPSPPREGECADQQAQRG